MREILFRGKRADNGEWITGDLRQYINMCADCENFYEIDTMSTEEGYGNSHKVIAETIGQFTELLDKNRNKIYEGDILFYTDIFDESLKGEKYIVGIGECMALDNLSGYGVYVQDQEGDKMLLNADELTLSRLEIIGNIYNNPELLEK